MRRNADDCSLPQLERWPPLKALSTTEMQKVGDTGDISLLSFLAGANFWAILGNFWAILGNFWAIWAILGNFWAIMGNFG